MEHVDDPTLISTLLRIHRHESDMAELDFSMLQSENKRLEPHGGALVARVLATNQTVKRLIIRDQDIGDEGAIALAEALRSNNSLEYIDLYGNNITDAGVEALAVALYGHESVIHLALWSNSITDRGAIALAAALRCNRRLVYLGLVHNQITRDGAQALLDALEVNVHLETLNPATNRVPPSVISAIRVALARNRIEAPLWRRSHELAEEEAKKLRAGLIGHERGIKKDEDTCSETSSEVSDTSGFLSCSDDEEALIWDDFNGTEMWI